MSQEVSYGTPTEIPQRVNEFRRFSKVFLDRPLVIMGSIVIFVLIICAIIPGVIAPYDPLEQRLSDSLHEPGKEHLLGADSLGRDVFSRIIYGARTALMVGVVALLISATAGTILGVSAGYLGGTVQAVILRFTDALMAFPGMLLALLIAALMGGGIFNIMLAVGIGSMSGFVRIMCGQAISIREKDYILAARSMGVRTLNIMFRHVLRNGIAPLIVMMTVMIGQAILTEAGLSFLGIGIKEPNIGWGSMVSVGYSYLLTLPLLSAAPGFAIMVVVFAFNMVGDGLRDALDPKLRGLL
jgi:peptide/nickel transport system permease protein